MDEIAAEAAARRRAATTSVEKAPEQARAG